MDNVNQDYLKLNKNLILGAIVAGILAAIVAYIFSDQEDYLLTTYTVLAEYIGFFVVFIPLFFRDNKSKYILKSGKKDKSKIKNDLIKLGTSFGIGEIFYLSTRWLSGYYLLTLSYDPNIATIISEVLGSVTFFMAVNLMTKFTKLYKHQK